MKMERKDISIHIMSQLSSIRVWLIEGIHQDVV